MTHKQGSDSAGPNSWLIDEYYSTYQDDPGALPEEWQEEFARRSSAGNGGAPAPAPAPSAGNGNGNGNGTSALPEAPASQPEAGTAQPERTGADEARDGRSGTERSGAEATKSRSEPASAEAGAEDGETPAEEPGEPLRGVAARIVDNMEASLGVPTATSFREVPAKLLEVNRKVLNNHLKRIRGGKVSFTHIIGYAVVRAVARAVPNMNNTFVTGADGKPRIVRNQHINLGIAVDQEKADGSRSLIVPVIKSVEEMTFSQFVDAYEGVIRKVRANKLQIDDLMGATITLTNPGTIGTIQSVPRLMRGQGAIVGVGAIGYPAEYQAADPRVIAQLGLSKVIAITSTYDHRIIQGAESGLFLKKVHELLLGEDDFYADAFSDMGVPYEAVQWRMDRGATEGTDPVEGAVAKQMAVSTLVNQYRVRGHLIANTNPLDDRVSKNHSELDPATYGLTIWDLDREFLTGNRDGIYAAVGGQAQRMRLGDILGVLRDAYSRTIGIEYMHIANPEEKRWIQEQVEGRSYSFDRAAQHHILERLSAAEAIEKFLAARYVGQKRFGLEGAESAIPTLDAILSAAADHSLERAVIGMAHRGRLNVLVNILGKHYRDLFSEFEGAIDENSIQGSGDVKYHLGFEGVHTSPAGNSLDLVLAANPSHLEAVDPVVVGMCRAYMDRTDRDDYPILPLLIHGDAAFAGQGVVTETLNLSQVHGYKVGGTVHLIINNQLGYTTAPHQSRSFEYSTDIAKAVQAPIFHVNADDPEACVRVAALAFDYRQRFNKDVVIDMIGYRRHGHNEGDDPSYTQPLMYRKIGERPSARSQYTQLLIDRGDISLDEADKALDYFQSMLQEALDDTRGDAPPEGLRAKPAPPPVGVLPHVETGVGRHVLDRIYTALSSTPEGFTTHPKLARQLEARTTMWESGEVDWALAEAFAIGSFLDAGTSVRLAGQDSRRGTFAHRHATLHDYETGEEYTPLAAVASDRDTRFWVYDSTLSEYAAMGFEYGYSLANPDALVMWEAQFGDFVNGAQIIVDQYLVAAEDKWNETTSLVLLLPHGFEGAGPEHSSGRLERFLLLCAEDNIQVANVTTAAQFFHLLRRQLLRAVRKPLVVFTPKSGLRAKSTRSPVDAITSGSFEEVLEDPGIDDPGSVKRIILASGQVSSEALAHRDEVGAPVAVVRVEQLYPWPFADVARSVTRYTNAREIVWLQEEPENMGAWNSVKGRLYEAHGETHLIRRVSRTESGSPATGSNAIHRQEQEELLQRAFGALD